MVEKNRKEIDTFCHNVSALRKSYSLSKKEMAAILGIGIESLNKLEKGIIPERMSCVVIVRVSVIFKIPIKNLFLDNL